MKCINCGTEIPDDAVHCRICGTIYKREQKRTPVGLWIASGVLAFAAGAFAVSFMHTNENVPSTQIVFEEIEIEPTETTDVTVSAEVKKDVEPEVTPESQKGVDVEAQVLVIREKYNEIVENIVGGVYRETTEGNGIIRYTEGNQLQAILVPKGVGGCTYRRCYYYVNEQLFFSYYEGVDAHRFYFFEGQLIRWRYSWNALEAQDAVNHDLEQSKEFVEWEKQIFEDSAEFSDLQSNDYYVVPEGNLESDDFVRVRDYIPKLSVELKYATEENFTGEIIYDFREAYLRYGTVKKLMQVQDDLEAYGYFLKIWDAFRPIEAQFALWEVCPNSAYVANPNKGYSSHSKGNTVDITLVDEKGTEVEMPTGFDDFSKMADRDYSDCTQQAKEHALILEEIMSENGFNGYSAEWWHYTDTDAYPVEKEFLPKA